MESQLNKKEKNNKEKIHAKKELSMGEGAGGG